MSEHPIEYQDDAGLTLTAKVVSGGTEHFSGTMSQDPSGFYHVTASTLETASVPAGTHQVRIEDDNNELVAFPPLPLEWDGTQELPQKADNRDGDKVATADTLDSVKTSTDLITSGTEITVSSVYQEGDDIELFQGESRTESGGNALTFNVSPSKVDLTGRTVYFGMGKLVEQDGDDSLNKTGTVEDANGENQRMVFELTTADTESLALDDEDISAIRGEVGRAYEYQIAYSENGGIAMLSDGEVSVNELYISTS